MALPMHFSRPSHNMSLKCLARVCGRFIDGAHIKFQSYFDSAVQFDKGSENIFKMTFPFNNEPVFVLLNRKFSHASPSKRHLY